MGILLLGATGGRPHAGRSRGSR